MLPKLVRKRRRAGFSCFNRCTQRIPRKSCLGYFSPISIVVRWFTGDAIDGEKEENGSTSEFV